MVSFSKLPVCTPDRRNPPQPPLPPEGCPGWQRRMRPRIPTGLPLQRRSREMPRGRTEPGKAKAPPRAGAQSWASPRPQLMSSDTPNIERPSTNCGSGQRVFNCALFKSTPRQTEENHRELIPGPPQNLFAPAKQRARRAENKPLQSFQARTQVRWSCQTDKERVRCQRGVHSV